MISADGLKPNLSEDINHLFETTLSFRNSCNSKNEGNTASIQNIKQKVDATTLTDKVICKCDFDEMKKLKDKAHKSFMQVIQIESLYREEIEQLEAQYEQREKTQLKKFQCKENMLNEKCKQLEQELEKAKQNLEKEKEQKICRGYILQNHQLEISIESPFIVDSIDKIECQQTSNGLLVNQNDSVETIKDLKQFIPEDNLKYQLRTLIEGADDLFKQFQIGGFKDQQQKLKDFVSPLKNTMNDAFSLIRLLIECVISTQERYNILSMNNLELQNRYSRLQGNFDKESKFMSEQIRRISQEKIKMDKKLLEEQKINKELNQSVYQLKKIIIDNGILFQGSGYKDFDSKSAYNLQMNQYRDDKSLSSSSSLAQRTENLDKNSHLMNKNLFLRMSAPPVNKSHPFQNFKKKIPEKKA